jgi:hypothetical protein
MIHSIRIREDFMRDPHFEALPFFYTSPSRPLWDFCDKVFQNIKYDICNHLNHAELPNSKIDR